jgi:hypothetical protein
LFSDLRSFLSFHTFGQVPLAEEAHDLSGLRLLASLLDEADVTALVKKHFDTIFAFSWPHIAVGDGMASYMAIIYSSLCLIRFLMRYPCSCLFLLFFSFCDI